MNTKTITSAVVAGLMVVLVTACGTTRSYPDNRPYPGQPRNGYPYPYPEGRYPDSRYPDSRYPDRRYPDSRYPDRRTYPDSRYSKRLPPGQAKKIYGGKSAKVYSRGHNKERDWDKDRDYNRKKKHKH